MYIIMKSDELMHYGVRGMRWGVRKDTRELTNLVNKELSTQKDKKIRRELKREKRILSKRARSEIKQAKIEKKRQKAMSVTSSARYTYKQRKHLSDNELRARINRLNMEKQLKDLSRGRGLSEPQVISSGRQAASQAIGKYGAKMAVSALGGEFGPAAAAFIKPKK